MTDTDDIELTIDSRPASFNAEATAELLGLSAQQMKWCLARLRGANQTQAAREAGYQGSNERLRSAGSRIANSSKVQRFMELAALEGGELTDQPMDVDERRRILSRIARGNDKNAAIRAAEVMHRMDEAERAARPNEELRDPLEVLDEMALHNVALAAALARIDGAPWVPPPAVAADVERWREKIAREWLAERAQRNAPSNVVALNPGDTAA